MKNHVVFEQVPVFLQWAEQQLDIKWDAGKVMTISHVRENDDGTHTILAVVVLSNWMKHNVELSVASSDPSWATRKFLKALYDYVFQHRLRTTSFVEETNTRSADLQVRLGYKYEGKLDDWFGPGRPALVFGLTRDRYASVRWASRTKNKREADELQRVQE